MTRSSESLGAAGEAFAAHFLAERGWKILARNIRSAGVEIDLVTCRAGILAFVEVKTRRTRTAGLPEESVDARKRARLVRGAVAWLQEHRPRRVQVRFDVVAVERGPKGWQCRHLPGAFDAGD